MTDIPPTAPSRDEIRAAIFSSKKPKFKLISFYGQQIELRQPRLKDILDSQNLEDRQAAVVEQLVKYAFVPGTDIHIFESADLDGLMELPFGGDLVAVTTALQELTEVNFLDGKLTSASTL